MSETLNLSFQIKSWDMFIRGLFGIQIQIYMYITRLQGGKPTSQQHNIH